MRLEWFYIREHPVTDERSVDSIMLVWNEESGDWQYPADQPTLPQMYGKSDFYPTREEAMTALRKGEYNEDAIADDGIRGI